jgi:hypothetical protein
MSRKPSLRALAFIAINIIILAAAVFLLLVLLPTGSARIPLVSWATLGFSVLAGLTGWLWFYPKAS